jgi:triosephosphate isomerase
MFLIANWKAYVEDLPKAKTLVAAAKRAAKRGEERIVLAPPAPLMGHLALMRLGPVALAAQDVSLTTGGAHTGEATAQAFAAAGATYALIGHSERRAAGDSDRIVAEKLAHAVAHGLTPVLCVGEAARDADGRYLQGIREQLGAAVASATPQIRRAGRVASGAGMGVW